MLQKENKLMAAILAALVLAGCGASPAATKVPRSTNGTKLQDGAGIMPQQPGNLLGAPGLPGQAGSGPEGLQLLNATRNVLTQITGFDAQIRSFSQGHWKQGEKVEELRKATTEARIIWIKPLKLRAEVIQTTNPLLKGAAMATNDGKTITARAAGLLGLIPFKLQITDPKLGNNRNHSLPENNPKTQLERLTSPSATWTVVGEQIIEGVACKMVQVDNIKRLDNEVTREVIAVDPQKMTLRKLAMFDGDLKIVDHTFLKFRWNPKVSAASFNLSSRKRVPASCSSSSCTASSK